MKKNNYIIIVGSLVLTLSILTIDRNFTSTAVGHSNIPTKIKINDRNSINQYYKDSDGDNWQPALQRALDAAKDGSTISIYIPKGIYKFKDTCVIYSNTTINMDKDAHLILDGAYRFFINGDKDLSYYGYNGNSNITISGGILDVNKQNRGAISFAHGKNIVIKNTRIKNIVDGHGIELSALQNVVIRNCRFENFKNVDIRSRYYAEAIQLDINTEKAFHAFGDYDETINRNIIIDNCYFGMDSNPPKGFGAWPTGVGSHASLLGKWTINVLIKNCTFDKLTCAGIRNIQWSNTIIQNNSFINCFRAIKCEMKDKLEQNYSNITIRNNTLTNCGYNDNAIIVKGAEAGDKIYQIKAVKIIGNSIIQTSKQFNAINLMYVDTAVVNDNYSTYKDSFLEQYFSINVHSSNNK